MQEEYIVKFDGNPLNSVDGVTIYNHNFNQYPDKDLKIYKLARRSLSIVTSAEFTQKEISVYADVCLGTRSETEVAVRNLKALLVNIESPLVVLNGDIELQWTATLNEFNIKWDGGNAYCELVFIASTPIGQSTKMYELVNIIGHTSSVLNETAYVEGSYTIEPVITIKFNTAIGTGNFFVYNGKSNQGLIVEIVPTAGDIFVIDCASKKLTQNAIVRDFKGIFPTWGVGTQSFSYSDTFNSRDIDFIVEYRINIV